MHPPFSIRLKGVFRVLPRNICRLLLLFCAVALGAKAQESGSAQEPSTQQVIAQLLERLQAQDNRLKELENEVAMLKAAAPSNGQRAVTVSSPAPATVETNVGPTTKSEAPAATGEQKPAEESHGLGHTMQLPGGGPALTIRGFGDVNLGFGPVANPLQFPLPAPVHATFQLGELDLFLTSRLSKKVTFLGEVVYGSDSSNSWGLDVERLEIGYKPSRYFEVSAGRFHSAIGYYTNEFHHGAWFQTATGRPFMYFFEDAGGLLPIHQVGITSTGLVPKTGDLQLHWIAEIGNGRSSNPNLTPVQNFLSDRDHKSFNFALYSVPQWVPGLRIGGSFYRDRIVPANLVDVTQDVASFYVVYKNSDWELLNEGVLLRNKSEAFPNSFNTPLAYAQISRKFGVYRPYFRFQYVNSPNNDPINQFRGRYDGPSLGLRMDFTDYAALKAQYNRVYLRNASPQNGLDLQVSFIF